MSFASVEFVVFFAVVLLGTSILQKIGNTYFKHCFLLAASYFFYGYWDWRFCFLLLFVTVTAFLTAKFVKNTAVFIVGVTVPLLALGVFKYFNFFISSFSVLFGGKIGAFHIILPVGISFYTFQALSYVIDVRRGKIKAEKSFVDLALYISFFPQLVAGPIVKASDFLPQLHEDRRVTLAGLEQGVQIMLFGLFKKIVLADHLSVFVDDVFFAPAAYNWSTLVLAVISYSLQIYFDFSGYSDIAIGCAKCFGYEFRPNFDLPYVSSNVTEFWRRWHISLSTWLKEYLYISLGGNRKGRARQYLNLMVTMLLGGLWHGANWTFVFWGGLNGLALCLDKLRKPKNSKGLMKFAGIAGTFAFISFTWIFFRADSFSAAWAVIKGIATLQQGIVQNFFWSYVAIFALLMATAFAVVRKERYKLAALKGYYFLTKLDNAGGVIPVLHRMRISACAGIYRGSALCILSVLGANFYTVQEKGRRSRWEAASFFEENQLFKTDKEKKVSLKNLWFIDICQHGNYNGPNGRRRMLAES